ncbi:MAG: nicotinate phosphoribosyltransferase [Planctomycetota bacterium]
MKDLDRPSTLPGSAALLTDLYQLTMARGHWRAGRLDARGVFHLSFRRAPFGGTWALAAGIGPALDAIERLGFTHEDVEALAALPGARGKGSLFENEFLDLLRATPQFQLDVDVIPEGSIALPGVPMVKVTGPLWQAQLVETILLNMIGYDTLIATKAARVVHAAAGASVLEFGARRAQGPGASVTAARAAWIGGVAGTSNVLAAAQLGIPVKGTHAHAWVQSFAGDDSPDLTEARAFEAFAESMPDGCVLLVDTYDTLAGVARAIEVARGLRSRGHELTGIRLDSGDLVELSRKARAALDDAGFPDVAIVASDDLDERRITELRAKGARIDSYGVGTRLVTGGDQASLGVVYKLSAVTEGAGEPWRPVMKLSANPIKRSLPGDVHVLRHRGAGKLLGDFVALDTKEASSLGGNAEPLLVPALRAGELVGSDLSDLAAARERARSELASLPEGAFYLDAPAPIPTELSGPLRQLQETLVQRAQSH